jgi:hypothetical protein
MLTVALACGDGGPIARIDGLDQMLIARSDEPAPSTRAELTTYRVCGSWFTPSLDNPACSTPKS